LEPYNSGRLGFLNTYFNPAKANVLYNQYHKQSALADEVGFDGMMSNEHNFLGAYPYRYGDGEIEPIRCALIGGRLGDRCSQY